MVQTVCRTIEISQLHFKVIDAPVMQVLQVSQVTPTVLGQVVVLVWWRFQFLDKVMVFTFVVVQTVLTDWRSAVTVHHGRRHPCHYAEADPMVLVTTRFPCCLIS